MVTVLTVGVAFVTGAEDSTPSEEKSTEQYSFLGALGGVALQPDGRIVVASGSYLESFDAGTGICGTMQSGAFRFNPDGTLDRGFHCNIDTIGLNCPQNTRLVSDANARLLMTGSFHSVDGKPRPGCAMLLPNGQLDESFEPWRGWTNPPARTGVGGVYDVALLNNDSVAVVSFMLDAPYPTAYLLDAVGHFVPPPKPSVTRSKFPNALIFTLTPTGLGIQREIDWTKNTRTEWDYWPPAHMPEGLPFPQWGEKPSALDMSEALQSIFEEVPLELCRYAVRLPNGGFILAVQEPGGSRFMRFDKNWHPDLSFTNHFEVNTSSDLNLALQADGKLLVAGNISKLNGESFTGLARLDQTGATDHDFHCQTAGGPSTAGKGDVMGIAVQKDGRIIIVGYFSKVNGVDVPYLARLNSDGSLDQPFQSHFTSSDNLKKAIQRVKVHNLAASTTPNNAATTPGMSPIASIVQTVVITSFNVANGVAALQFHGNSNFPYILQAANDLSQSNWVNVDTNQTTTAGTGTLRDEDAKNYPMRFYRVATP